MKKWILKAIIQKTISYLPWSNQINYLFQKYVTKGVYLTDDYFYDRLGHASDHLKCYQKYNNNTIPHTSLEIGTGWYPVVPISIFLVGGELIYSVDIAVLTSKERLKTTIYKFLESDKNGQLKKYIDYNADRWVLLNQIAQNIEQLSIEQILQKLNITYLIQDAAKLSLTDGSVDFISSNNTFEHIYPQWLIPILKEFKRIIKKEQGVMSHFIDMSDHFAHFDKTISIYNFLKYSDSQWQRIDNSIQPQNRLRMYDYAAIYADLDIPITEKSFEKGNPNEVKNTALNEKFSGKPVEEIAISHCHFVSLINK